MTKNILRRSLFLLAVTGLIFANSGCTSKKAEDQQVIENADAEKIEAESADISGDAEATDLSLEADLGETASTVSTETPPPAATTDTPAVATLDDSSLDAEEKGASTTEATPLEPLPEEAAPAITADAEVAPVPVEILPTTADSMATKDEPVSEFPNEAVQPTPVDAGATVAVDASTAVDTGGAMAEVAAKPSSSGTLKKVATTTPYQGKDGGWINTVYVARPKETLSNISLKIYGTDKSKELKKIAENSYLKSRSAKAGDKIYYVSPNRPDDSTKTMLYQEDMGMIPETYVAKKGDNLRKISKELLGYDGAWKEIWTSNSVESKTALNDGETLRYWKADSSASTAGSASDMASSTQESGSANLVDASQVQAGMPDSSQLPAPASMEPPPPPVDTAMADSAAMELPPPPAELAPPPPPPPPPPDEMAAEPVKKKINLDEAAAEETDGGLDSDTMTSMGALGVLVALLAIVIIRKRKQKANAMQMVDDQMNA